VAQEAIDCNQWVRTHLASGTTIIIPEIADYEVRRELIRVGITKGIIRLETLETVPGITYLPITTAAMRLAAEFWAQSRQVGRPTADPKEMDGDVIVAAQVHTVADEGDEVTVATTNPGHLGRFVAAAAWRDIRPG
jgi:hypothetical protein